MATTRDRYNPTVPEDAPQFLHEMRKDDSQMFQQAPATDGTVYHTSHVLAWVSEDTTHLGNDQTPNSVQIEPIETSYDRAERGVGKNEKKVWVFTHGGHEVMVDYRYIETVRDVTTLSLDAIRRRTQILESPTSIEQQGNTGSPIHIETDTSFNAVIMPLIPTDD